MMPYALFAYCEDGALDDDRFISLLRKKKPRQSEKAKNGKLSCWKFSSLSFMEKVLNTDELKICYGNQARDLRAIVVTFL